MSILSSLEAKLEAVVTLLHDEVIAVASHLESIVVSLVATVVALAKRIVLVPVRLIKALLVDAPAPVAPAAVEAPIDSSKV